MNPNTFSYLTLERTQMNRWTRKRRLKFRKRWRKQHGGRNFYWTQLTYVHAAKSFPELQNMIVFLRDPDKISPFSKA